MNNILLVNKNKKLDKNYVPYDLVKTNSKYKDNVMLSKIAYDNFLKFQEYLQSKGISIDIESGYPFKYGELVDHFKYTMEDEEMEATTIYPSYAEVARREGFESVAEIFDNVASVENCHYNLTKQIYEGLKNNTLYSSKTSIKWKCSNCGYEHTQKTAWKVCALCSMPQGYVEVPFELGKMLKDSTMSDMDTKNK